MIYRRLLEIRRREIIPRLGRTLRKSGSWEVLGDGAVRVAWPFETGGGLVLTAALSSTGVAGVDLRKGRAIWIEGGVEQGNGKLGPWSAQWTIEDDDPITAY